MPTIEIVMSREEVDQNIHYGLIYTTRFSSAWKTMLRKLRWEEEFSETEQFKAEKLFCQAHNWAVGHGVPETVRVDLFTFGLWKKIEAFCKSLP